MEDGAHALRLGAVLAGGLDLDRPRRRVDVEGHGDDPVVEAATDLVAGGLEDLEHRAVLGEHLGGELPQARLPSGRGEVLEEDRADPAPLVGVGDVERDLCRGGEILS